MVETVAETMWELWTEEDWMQRLLRRWVVVFFWFYFPLTSMFSFNATTTALSAAFVSVVFIYLYLS